MNEVESEGESSSLKEKNCRGCGHALPAPFLDLGRMPLANSLVDPARAHLPEPFHPLAVAYCPDCSLVQITHTIPPRDLFTEYVYFSSYSESLLDHAQRMAETLIERFGIHSGSRVIEIASNDGYLLRNFVNRGINVLGIEPARNIAQVALEKGIPTWSEFFGKALSPQVLERFGAADLIIGNNVLAHVPAINDFLEGVRECLAPEGVAVFEFPHLRELISRLEFDTIYHEHVFYYSLEAVVGLARRAGLEVFDAGRQKIHGGTLRVYLCHRNHRPVSSHVRTILSQEAQEGLTSGRAYTDFAAKVRAIRQDLTAFVLSARSDGQRVAAYGAPAKGNVLLNSCRLTSHHIEFTVDRSPHKQGRLLPGSRIPVRPPEALSFEAPAFALVLAWNFAAEIVRQQRGYLKRGGAFILPIPLSVLRDLPEPAAGHGQPEKQVLNRSRGAAD